MGARRILEMLVSCQIRIRRLELVWPVWEAFVILVVGSVWCISVVEPGPAWWVAWILMGLLEECTWAGAQDECIWAGSSVALVGSRVALAGSRVVLAGPRVAWMKLERLVCLAQAASHRSCHCSMLEVSHLEASHSELMEEQSSLVRPVELSSRIHSKVASRCSLEELS